MGQLHLEDIIEQTGGCGRYQVILSFIVHAMKCVVCFSMLFMVFGAAKPDWWCADDIEGLNVTYTSYLVQYKSCTSRNDTTPCKRFIFEDSMKTVVTQWDLICDRAWISSAITSIQMVGVLLGNLACGQVADLVGRKHPLFLSLLFLIMFNIMAAFSTSWLMFAIIRFFIGLAMGFELTVQYNVMSEFTMSQWRTWVVAVPSWAIEMALFAMVTWLLKNWQHIHIATAVIGVPLLATYWFVPESFRWYVGHDRIKDAENVIKKVAKVNRKPVPDLSELDMMKKKIEEMDFKDKKYSFIDIVKSKELRKYTLLFIPVWITLGLGGYGIQFGVTALSGNLYVNIFILGLIGGPLQFVLIYLQNRFGRKKTAIFFYSITGATTFIVAISHRFNETSFRNQLANIAAILSLTAINAAWSPIQTLTIETYPTVVRNIGFGFQNTMARVGAVIGPQLVFLDHRFDPPSDHNTMNSLSVGTLNRGLVSVLYTVQDTKVAGMMYWICTVATVVSIFIVLPIPETAGKDLADKIASNEEETEDVVNINTEAVEGRSRC